MSIVKTQQKLEDCIDGSMIYEFILREAITIDFINFLRKIGSLDYYPDFPKPLFRAEIKGLSQMTGCLGNDRFRVTLYRNAPQKNLLSLNRILAEFDLPRGKG